MPSQQTHERIKRCIDEGATEAWVPQELALGEILMNNTLPPCSLNDFMDYLVHVEHKAEYLQFCLWFIEYIERWSRLCPKTRALSPRWDHPEPESPAAAQPGGLTTMKLDRILSILAEDLCPQLTKMERLTEVPSHPVSSERRNHTRRPSVSSTKASTTLPSRKPSNSRRPPTPLGTGMLMYDAASCSTGNTFTIQPFRDELSRVVRHYIHPIAETTPRPLHLVAPDARIAIHKAVHQTTHPSTVIPAIKVAEHIIRRAHPQFVKWVMRNANAPRLTSWAILGSLGILVGAAVVVICAQMALRNSPMWLWALRAAVACVFWWPSLLVIFASLRGLCIVRFLHRARDVRPWELGNDALSADKSLQNDDASEMMDPEKGLGHLRKSSVPGHSRAQSLSQISVMSEDPLRKPTLQTFGPANYTEGDLDAWNRMSLWRRIFPPEVDISQGGACWVRWLQRRALAYSGLWALLVTGLLVAWSAFLPVTPARSR